MTTVFWFGVGWAALSGCLTVLWVLIAYAKPRPQVQTHDWMTEDAEHDGLQRAADPVRYRGPKGFRAGQQKGNFQ
jgi:hypothetical protein